MPFRLSDRYLVVFSRLSTRLAAIRQRLEDSRIAAALGSLAVGGLIALSMPPWGWWPLGLLGLAGFERLLADRPARSRAARGFGLGLGWLLPSTFWMVDFSAVGYVVMVAITAGMYAAAGLACPPGRARWLALPGLFALVALLRWRWPFGGVPLATLAMSQVDSPLASVVRLLGPSLLVALTVAVAMLPGVVRERRWLAALVVAAVVVGAGSWAAAAPRGSTTGTLQVAVVQGGGPQRVRAADANAAEVFQRHMDASARVPTPVDLVVWPEDVVDVAGRFAGSTQEQRLSELARRLDAVLVAGVVEDVSAEEFANFAAAFTPAGEVVDRYDKVRLVPFGEYVPLRGLIEPFASEELPKSEGRPGKGSAVLDTPVGRLGVAISWEVFFEDRARDAIGNGGTLLLNPTNGSSYWLTIVQTQQVASSRLRALETGRWVVQAAPTGFSAFVDPDGGVHQRTGVGEQAVIATQVQLREGLTLATRLGVWPMLALAAACAAAAWALHARRPGAVPSPHS